MKDEKNFDVIIVGGSYAGLSAAMALGRSLRKVLIIDSGNPCNKQTPHSHNFITQDGNKPKDITNTAKAQVLKYETVKFISGFATKVNIENNLFTIELNSDDTFSAKKVLLATGIKDIMPNIKGFAECWGISVLHCPYCHGYEEKNEKIGILGNGDLGFDLCKLLSNWSNDLILFTNGNATFTAEQHEKIEKHGIKIIEKQISYFQHENGIIEKIVFNDSSSEGVKAIFTKVPFKQHCDIPQQLGCELNEQGYIKIDDFQKTTVHGVYAAGDNIPMFRSVSAAVASGSKAGAIINKELIDETF